MFKFTNGWDWVKRSCALWAVQLGLIFVLLAVSVIISLVLILRGLGII